MYRPYSTPLHNSIQIQRGNSRTLEVKRLQYLHAHSKLQVKTDGEAELEGGSQVTENSQDLFLNTNGACAGLEGDASNGP